ncbi:fungal-specific transcription factor domain-containing protein [Phellopilus nigrolimitatus]|nr:fungal-specific transcription factor domain-containing protein [Phellopilus nigrolimitatus]
MNPGYPVNGSPYAHSHPAAPSPYHTAPSPHNGIVHAPPPYGYHPMQHYPSHQYHHPYPNYPPYPVPGYSPPPAPPAEPQPPPPEPSVSSGPVSKRKRKGTAESSKGKGSVASDAEESGVKKPTDFSVASDMHKKRTKTQRACDSCRSRKIRCDVLVDQDTPVCQHCKQYGFECTFFLPITETRFKKKRLEEEAQAAAAAAVVSVDKDKTAEAEGSQQSPLPETTRNVRVDGPTSMTHLLHSTATVPPRAYHSYDQRYNHTWEVSKLGDGLIQVLEPSTDESPSVLPKPIDLHVERDVIEKLINSYFTDVAPLVPIVTQAEFLALSDPSPPPILLYSICLVAASKRDVPQAVFDSLRVAVNDVIKSEDVLCTASIVNVQSLLILCQCADCHSQFVPAALSSLWIRLGTAIRMAQDLGLHRAEAVKKNIEMRRRVWGACVITDRWTSLTYGHPYMIDVEDCDARLPSSGDPNDLYTDELLRLSLILGRVLKTIYGPSGLTYATDEKLYALLNDMKAWRDRLPENLKFRGPDTPRSGGLLFLLYTSVSMIFWRVFMRISYSCPAHLKINLTIDQWTELTQMTGDAIDWLDVHETLYDVWMLVAYAVTSCALVQYHTWARRKDTNAQAKLLKLRDCVGRWEACLQPDQMSSRRKASTAEIITLLYETTLGPPSLDHPPGLNPTTGVTPKPQGDMNGLKYEKDPSRPGGGVFIAHGKAREGDYRELPEGTVIINPGMSDEESEGEELAEVSFAHPTNDSAPSSSFRNRADSGLHSASRAYHSVSPDASNVAVRHAFNTHFPSGIASSMVNFVPLAGTGNGDNFANVNPSLNSAGSTDVRVMNVLDVNPQPSMLEQMHVADSGFLEGIPGGMFDWPQWEHFFSRFSAPADPNALAAFAQAQTQAQQQQQADHNISMNSGQQQQQQYRS